MVAYDDPAYQAALNTYMQMHCNDVNPGPDAPECVRRPKRGGHECYVTAWGPDELTPTGTLATFAGNILDFLLPRIARERAVSVDMVS